jgi:hypothetical protein
MLVATRSKHTSRRIDPLLLDQPRQLATRVRFRLPSLSPAFQSGAAEDGRPLGEVA